MKTTTKILAAILLAALVAWVLSKRRAAAVPAAMAQPILRQYDAMTDGAQKSMVTGTAVGDVLEREQLGARGITDVENLLFHHRSYSLDPGTVDRGFFRVQI